MATRKSKHGSKTRTRTGVVRRRRKWYTLTTLASTLLFPATLAGISSALLSTMFDSSSRGETVLASPRDPELGAGGTIPQSPAPSPELLRHAVDPKQLAAGARTRIDIPNGSLHIPEPILAAYVSAADRLSSIRPDCGLHWSVLASIGRIESGHARSGQVDEGGTTASGIFSPPLSGVGGAARIPDTDAGELDRDPMWDRAVGVMQFTPLTWSRYSEDGDDNGETSPHNVNDAIVTAGKFLCSGGADLRDSRALASAVFRYNPSENYVRTVLVWASAYAQGGTPAPAELAPEEDVLAGSRIPEDADPLVIPPLPPVGPMPSPVPGSLHPSSLPVPPGALPRSTGSGEPGSHRKVESPQSVSNGSGSHRIESHGSMSSSAPGSVPLLPDPFPIHLPSSTSAPSTEVPDALFPGSEPPFPEETAPKEESSLPESADSAPRSCVSEVLAKGAFDTEKPGAGSTEEGELGEGGPLEPGSSEPDEALPGALLYVSSASGAIEPCAVPLEDSPTESAPGAPEAPPYGTLPQ